MTDFTIHTVPGSPFARSVMAALEEKGASYRIAPLAPGESKQPEHLARHPFGRMPVLDHGDFRLYETQAILRYFDRILPEPPLTPADPRAAARMDQLMSINDWYLFQGCLNVIGFQRIIAPRLLGLAPDEQAIAAAMPQARTVFPVLASLLGEQDYLAGDSFSLADLHIAPHLDLFTLAPEWAELTAQTPNLPAWLARVAARPSMQATTWERVAAKAAA
jgi:glutathione S-transferase